MTYLLLILIVSSIPLYATYKIALQIVTFNLFTKNALPSIELLEQQKNAINKARINLESFLNHMGNSKVDGKHVTKNLIFADIKDVTRLKNKYYEKVAMLRDQNDQDEVEQFDKLTEDFILNVTDYIRNKELNLSKEQLLKQRDQIENSHQNLEKYILLLMENEYDEIESMGEIIKERLQKSLNLNVILVIFAGFFAVILAILASRMIYSPIMKLRQISEKIADGDFSQQIKIDSHDEIQVLAETMQLMLTRTLQTARLAGMNEITSSILHNIGNILNSINITALTLLQNLKDTNMLGLSVVGKLLELHKSDFENFVKNDPQGQNLIQYINELPGFWEEKKAMFLLDLETLNKYIDNVKHIIASQ